MSRTLLTNMTDATHVCDLAVVASIPRATTASTTLAKNHRVTTIGQFSSDILLRRNIGQQNQCLETRAVHEPKNKLCRLDYKMWGVVLCSCVCARGVAAQIACEATQHQRASTFAVLCAFFVKSLPELQILLWGELRH